MEAKKLDRVMIPMLRADTITEYLNEGIDTVIVYGTSWVLGDNLENLESITGFGTESGTGNSLNTITGGGANSNLNGGIGNDTLVGGFGLDRLTGGAGADCLSSILSIKASTPLQTLGFGC